jgi:hypothetical protein
MVADLFATLDLLPDDDIPCQTARPQPNCGRSMRPGDQN